MPEIKSFGKFETFVTFVSWRLCVMFTLSFMTKERSVVYDSFSMEKIKYVLAGLLTVGLLVAELPVIPVLADNDGQSTQSDDSNQPGTVSGNTAQPQNGTGEEPDQPQNENESADPDQTGTVSGNSLAPLSNGIQLFSLGTPSTYDIALSNVSAGGTLDSGLGTVECVYNGTTYALGTDCDGDGANVTVSQGDTGGENPHLKYQYTIQEGTFVVRVTPASGKQVSIQKDVQGTVTDQGTYTAVKDYTPASGERVCIEFADEGVTNPPQGGNTPTNDGAPAENDIKIVINDNLGNNVTYEQLNSNNISAKIEYSYDQSTWKELTSSQVNADESLKLYSAFNGMDVNQYYFTTTPVYIRTNVGTDPITGKTAYFKSDQLNSGGKVQANTVYTLTTGQTCDLTYDNDIVTLVWPSDALRYPDGYIKDGKVKVLNAAYSGSGTAGSNDLFFGYDKGFPYSGISSDGTEGHVGIQRGATVTVQIIPDYGYQLTTASLNGCTLTPNTGTTYQYTFTINNPLQLSATMTPMSDEISSSATGVTGGSIGGGAGAMTGGTKGNLRLGVSNATMTEEQKQAVADATTAEISQYLEVNLKQFVKQGSSSQEWTNELEELASPITVTLNVGIGLDTSKAYVVVREHEGVYTEIPATYNPTAGTLSFQSDKFSNYALGAKEKSASDPGTGGSNGSVGASSGAVTAPAEKTPTVGNSQGWEATSQEVNTALAQVASGTVAAAVVPVQLNGTEEIPEEVLATIAGKDVTMMFVTEKDVIVNVNGAAVDEKAPGKVSLTSAIDKEENLTIQVRNSVTDITRTITIFAKAEEDATEGILYFIGADGSLIPFRKSIVYANGYLAFEVPFVNANYVIK